MDGTQTLESPQQDVTSVRLARVGLPLAGVGAVVIVLNPFGIAIAGLVMCVVGAALAFRLCWGQRWYLAVAGGAVGGILAKLIAGPHQTLGGWLAVAAALSVMIGSTLTYPTEE
jgi:hypothetical protein